MSVSQACTSIFKLALGLGAGKQLDGNFLLSSTRKQRPRQPFFNAQANTLSTSIPLVSLSSSGKLIPCQPQFLSSAFLPPASKDLVNLNCSPMIQSRRAALLRASTRKQRPRQPFFHPQANTCQPFFHPQAETSSAFLPRASKDLVNLNSSPMINSRRAALPRALSSLLA